MTPIPSPSIPSFLFQPDDWLKTLPIESLFPTSFPIEADIGCGKGRFLLARARATPHVNYLGIDRMLRRIRKLDRKIARASLSNIRLIRVEASYAVRYLLSPCSLSAAYIFFPDPWPKRRHLRHRLLTPDFVNYLHATLVPGGEVHLKTDHLDYLSSAEKAFCADGRYEPIPAPDFTDEELTDFELEFRNQGLTIGRCSFRRKAAHSNMTPASPACIPAADALS